MWKRERGVLVDERKPKDKPPPLFVFRFILLSPVPLLVIRHRPPIGRFGPRGLLLADFFQCCRWCLDMADQSSGRCAWMHFQALDGEQDLVLGSCHVRRLG